MPTDTPTTRCPLVPPARFTTERLTQTCATPAPDRRTHIAGQTRHTTSPGGPGRPPRPGPHPFTRTSRPETEQAHNDTTNSSADSQPARPRAARVLIATVRTMIRSWDAAAPGVLRLPSGRLIRGRGLGRPLPAGPRPTFAVHLLEHEPPAVPWDTVRIYWPDFGLPNDHRHLRCVLTEAWRRAEAERVEVVCWGGRGRTGTALACLSVLDGLPADQAVAYVRTRYDAKAIETRQQERIVTGPWV
jgi:hypothetical protein